MKKVLIFVILFTYGFVCQANQAILDCSLSLGTQLKTSVSSVYELKTIEEEAAKTCIKKSEETYLVFPDLFNKCLINLSKVSYKNGEVNSIYPLSKVINACNDHRRVSWSEYGLLCAKKLNAKKYDIHRSSIEDRNDLKSFKAFDTNRVADFCVPSWRNYGSLTLPLVPTKEQVEATLNCSDKLYSRGISPKYWDQNEKCFNFNFVDKLDDILVCFDKYNGADLDIKLVLDNCQPEELRTSK